jgi:hypothetical protein
MMRKRKKLHNLMLLARETTIIIETKEIKIITKIKPTNMAKNMTSQLNKLQRNC